MLRLGLCCIFRREPIRFRATTAKALAELPRAQRLARLGALALANAETLAVAVETVRRLGIGAFRLLSGLFPRYTHPDVGYALDDLPTGGQIRAACRRARALAARYGIRLSLHPDQFVVLSAPDRDVVDRSIEELAYLGFVADLVGAEVINLHAGGVYGDKETALRRFRSVVETLPDPVRTRLTVENDDRAYTVRDLIPLCRDLDLPLVYDVHHHRCNPDGLSVDRATAAAVETWTRAGREPYFHLSSPRAGWGRGDPRPHADFVDARDVPRCWLGLDATVDVEAKAKEVAVLRLVRDLSRLGASRRKRMPEGAPARPSEVNGRTGSRGRRGSAPESGRGRDSAASSRSRRPADRPAPE